jgi:hypothetical protein
MEEILYIWAKEHPEFKYQQGMNELLAVVVICLITEIVDKNQFKRQRKESEDMNSDEESDEVTPQQIFMALHDPEYLWTDCYLLFENILNLGVKELYYMQGNKDNESPERVKETKDMNVSRSN